MNGLQGTINFFAVAAHSGSQGGYFSPHLVYGAVHAKSTTLKPSLFFIQVCYRWPQKNDLHQFADFFETFSGSISRNCQFFAEGRYQFFQNLHHKFFD